MGYWRSIGLALAMTTALAAVVAAGAFVWLDIRAQHEPRVIAEIPGPPGTSTSYVLEYANDGDLVFRPKTGYPTIKYIDYYGDVNVADSRWLADDHLIITMRDGTKLEIRSKFGIEWPMTRSTP